MYKTEISDFACPPCNHIVTGPDGEYTYVMGLPLRTDAKTAQLVADWLNDPDAPTCATIQALGIVRAAA